MIKCPSRASTTGSCLRDENWHGNLTSMVTTTLAATFRWADVAYHRENASIAFHTFTDREEESANINATELLSTYDIFILGPRALVNVVMERMQQNPQSSSSGSTSSSILEQLLNSTGSGELGSSTNTNMLSGLLNLTSSSGSSSGLGALAGILKRQSDPMGSSTISDLISSFLGGGMSGASIPGTNPVFPALPFRSRVLV